MCTQPVGQPLDMAEWRRYRPDILLIVLSVRGRGDGGTLDEFTSPHRGDHHCQQREYLVDHVKLHITTLGAAGTVKDAQPALKRLSVGTASGADQESAKTT